MCLPVNCLKKYVGFVSFVTLVIACVAIGVGAAQIAKDSDVWQGTDYEWNKVAGALLVTSGVGLFIVSVFGVYGGCRKQKCCLCIFNFGMIIFVAVFLALSIGVAAITNDVVDKMEDDSTCSSTDDELKWLNKMDKAVNDAAKLFCQEGCQCYIKDGVFPTDFMESHFQSYSTKDDSLPTNVMDCPGVDGEDFSEKKYADFMKFVEENLNCSGICTAYDYYIFSDINDAHPTHDEGCKQQLVDFFDDYGRVIYIVGFCITGFLFFNTLMALCLCCHPSKREEGGSVYHRMSYFDN